MSGDRWLGPQICLFDSKLGARLTMTVVPYLGTPQTVVLAQGIAYQRQGGNADG